MDGLEYLKCLYCESYSIEVLSSVFVELLEEDPYITIWADGNDIKITSRKEYYAHYYIDPSIVRLFDINDFETGVLLYRAAAFKYKYESEEILSNLISVLESYIVNNRKQLTLGN